MTRMDARSRRSRWPAWLGVGAVLLLLGGGAGWAAATVLTPAEDVLESTPFTFVTVEQGEVGSSITLNTVAEWASQPVGVNRASGVVTSVEVTAGDEVRPGDVLYTVDMRPVVIAEGDVPAYRSLSRDARGADVAQLQRMLTATGHYSGSADGHAGAGTVGAIREWQRSHGLERTGVVGVGDVIFVPSLPARIALNDEALFRGASVSGGEDAVSGLSDSPSFLIPATDTQAGMMPLGTRVELRVEDGAWEGFVADHTRDEMSNTINVRLEGPDGTTVCGDECGQIPATGQTLLSSRIVTVEQVQGLTVPSAALSTDAAGSISVIDAEGVRHPVTVITSARGVSVIEGVDEGQRVRVPGTESSP